MDDKVGLVIFNFLLIIIMLVQLKHAKRYIIYPPLIFSASFFISFLLCMCAYYWDFSLSYKMYFVVLLTVVFFWIGCSFGQRITLSYKKESSFEYHENKSRTTVMLCLQLILCAFYVLFHLKIAGGISTNSILNIRNYYLYSEVPSYIGHIDLMMFSIAVIALYIMMYNKTEKKERISWKLIIIVLCYLVDIAISSSRSPFIYLCAFFLTVFVFFLQKNLKGGGVGQRKQNRKLIKTILGVVVVVFTGFVLLGFLTGKTAMLGVVNMVLLYFGGSIFNLNYLVENVGDFASPYPGCLSFPIIESVRNFLGVREKTYFQNILINNEIPLKPGYYAHSWSNLYSGIAKPLIDFGYVGMFLLFFLLGILYGYIYRIVCKKGHGLVVIYYGYLIMALVGVSSAWMFGAQLFSPAALYRMIYIFVFFHFWLKKQM